MKDKSYFTDNDLPLSQYYDQFETPDEIEVGKVYRQKGAVYWVDYRIVFIGEGVALGVEVANGNNNFNVGSKCLFNSSGISKGWKYNDTRSVYRLINEQE